MKLAILGAGTQARAIARDISRFSGAERVEVFDQQPVIAQALVDELGDGRFVAAELDVRDHSAVASALQSVDAALGAVSYDDNEALTKIAISTRTHFCDLGGNHDVVDAQLALTDDARAAGVLVIPDLGLAPGLAGLIGADLVRGFDVPESLQLRVGGLPVTPEEPLNYRLVFSVRGLINEYIEDCRTLEGGRLKIVPGLSELERLEFVAPFGELEAFQTSGGTATLTETLAELVPELSYKTIRYPGHCQTIRALQGLGLFEEDEIQVGTAKVIPRNVTEAVMATRLNESVDDVVLARFTCRGRLGDDRVEMSEELIEYGDAECGLSAMARCTGYPAAIVLDMIATGQIPERGVQVQERVVPMDRFRKALTQRGFTLRSNRRVL
ncbi:MAG: saccharopine dehydrogenase NADP-binding domain-containing protein [Polyangiaceae bacterium]|nr:saccharopine dehydrogenase NADP-binding domain-containing protein [Polyangiaceae bacterium]